MAIIEIYACGTSSTMTSADKLPSPVSIYDTSEQIWSEDTGRAQSGENIAKMVGKSIASKRTYQIKWGIISASEYTAITSKLTRGFFKFGVSTNGSVPTGGVFYRSEISRDFIQAGNNIYYKDVSVSVIEQ